MSVVSQGPPVAGLVALTFDDGPGPQTPDILDLFRQHGGCGTFFVLGESVEVYLDGGLSAGGDASTILDVTTPTPRVLRSGPIGLDVLHRFNSTIEGPDSDRSDA